MASANSPRNLRPLDRAREFCAEYGIEAPILLAPMAGACPASLSIAVANAGGMGAMGALLTPREGTREWVKEFREGSRGCFRLNTWVPHPAPAPSSSRTTRRVRT